MGEGREPVVADADRHHGVEQEQEQVGLVVPRQTFAAEVRVEAAQPAQTATTGAQATPVGELDRVGVAHHHVLDVAAAIDQDTDLPPDLPADLGQLPRELLRQQSIGGNAAPEEALELANLTGLEAVRPAEDLDGRLLTAGASIDGFTREPTVHLARLVDLSHVALPDEGGHVVMAESGADA